MKVYRLCRKDEFQNILKEKSFKNVGGYYSDFGCNKHTYQNDKKYLHFFITKSDILYLKSLNGRYICEYEIPKKICEKFIGTGKYWDFINFCELVEVKELAIPINCLKFDYLISVNKIIKDIDFEDMIDNINLVGYLQKVYNNEKNLEKTK